MRSIVVALSFCVYGGAASLIGAQETAWAPSPEGRPNTQVAVNPKQKELTKLLRDWDLAQGTLEEALLTQPEKEKELHLAHKREGLLVAKKIWGLIRLNLTQEWTIPGIEWFLTHPYILAQFPAPNPENIMNSLLDSIEFYLVGSPQIRACCAPLAFFNHPRAIPLLEKVFSINKDPFTRGYAALGLCIRMKKTEGQIETEKIAQTRGGFLRFAIENVPSIAYSYNFGNLTVEQVFREELYQLNSLSLKKEAPALRTTLLSGQALDTASLRGKPVLLVFVNAYTPEVDQSLELIQTAYEKLSPKGVSFSVIMHAAPAVVKDLWAQKKWTLPVVADESGEQVNIYRVEEPLESFLLDKEGKIQYKGAPTGTLFLTAEQVLKARSLAPKKP